MKKITLAFDIYGTLIDTAGIVVKLMEFVGEKALAVDWKVIR